MDQEAVAEYCYLSSNKTSQILRPHRLHDQKKINQSPYYYNSGSNREIENRQLLSVYKHCQSVYFPDL